MKPRLIPTYPKNVVDDLNHPPHLVNRLLFIVLVSLIVNIILVAVLAFISRRYPENDFARLFQTSAPASKPDLRRRSESTATEVLLKARPAIGSIVRAVREVGAIEGEVLSGFAFVSNDGVAISTRLPAVPPSDLRVHTARGPAEIERVVFDTLEGLSLVKVRSDTSPMAIAARGDLNIGDQVYVVRFSSGTDFGSIVELKIASNRSFTSFRADRPGRDHSDYLGRQLSVAEQFDRSWNGAPVLDVQMRFVGILSVAERTHVISAEYLRDLIGPFSRGETVRRPELQAEYIDLSLHVVPGIHERNGALITGFTDIGPNNAEPVSSPLLRVNDIIISVDQALLNGEYSLSEAVAAHRPGDRLTLDIIRDGETTTVNAVLSEHVL